MGRKASLENMGIKKTILVTGSEGYIGSVLVPKLIKKRYFVYGIDKCYYGKYNKNKKNFNLIIDDFRNLTNSFLKKIDCIVHLAAISNDPSGELNKNLTKEINYKGTIELALKAKKNKVKKFIFSSSCSVYGISKKEFVNENSRVNPLTVYAQSKINAEKDLLKLVDNKFNVNILRNSTVYGYSPSFRADLVVNNFVTCGLTHNVIKIMSDGEPWRPLIDVRDLSDIIISFLEKRDDQINGKILNIGFNENNIKIKDLLKKVNKYLPSCQIIYTGEHKDSRSYKVDFSKFKSFFPEIKQKWSLDRSIIDMIDKLKKIKRLKKNFLEGKYTRLEILKNKISILK